MKATHKYIIGFIDSVVLTLLSYGLVTGKLVSGTLAVAVIIVLAMAQLIVQLVFFLHLGQEERPRWKFWAFCAMSVVLLIVVVGSLWIMKNLNYNMMRMSPDEKNTQLLEERNKGY